jgi:hypothetical protein
VPLVAGATEHCNSVATISLMSALCTMTAAVQTFSQGFHSVDPNLLPPFVTFWVYKAAAIITERLFSSNKSNEELRSLRTLRNFLGTMGERWLGCGELSQTSEKGIAVSLTTSRTLSEASQRGYDATNSEGSRARIERVLAQQSPCFYHRDGGQGLLVESLRCVVGRRAAARIPTCFLHVTCKTHPWCVSVQSPTSIFDEVYLYMVHQSKYCPWWKRIIGRRGKTGAPPSQVLPRHSLC